MKKITVSIVVDDETTANQVTDDFLNHPMLQEATYILEAGYDDLTGDEEKTVVNYLLTQFPTDSDLVTQFIDTYGIKVKEDEELHYVELMMDNHICVEWMDEQYYILKDNSLYSTVDDIIYNFLEDLKI